MGRAVTASSPLGRPQSTREKSLAGNNPQEEEEFDEANWRQNSFIIDDFDNTVQKNEKKMSEPMHLDFYSATFYSMRKKVKK